MALYERINTVQLANIYTTNEQTQFLWGIDSTGLHPTYIDGRYRYGMNFKVGETGTNEANILYSIKVGLIRSVDGPVYLDVYAADANHKPTGVPLASASIPAGYPMAGGTQNYIVFELTPSITLAVNTEYCFVLSTTGKYYVYRSAGSDEE